MLVIQHTIGANSDSLVNPIFPGNASFKLSVSIHTLTTRTPPLLHFSSDSFSVFFVGRAEQRPPTRNFWPFIHQTYMTLTIFFYSLYFWPLFQLAVITNFFFLWSWGAQTIVYCVNELEFNIAASSQILWLLISEDNFYNVWQIYAF